MKRLNFWARLALLLTLVPGCLSVGAQGPSLLVPAAREQTATAAEASLLRSQMAARIAALPRFTGDFRLSAVGPEGRIRVLGQLLLERADKARITLLLPFGAPAWLGVSDGQTLAAWDIPRARIRRAPATRDGLAQLSALGDVGLTPAEAVALGWGEVTPPADASLQREPAVSGQGPLWLWRWRDAAGFARAVRVAIDGTVCDYELKNPAGDGALISFFARGALGVPSGLRVRLTPALARGSHNDAQVTVAEIKMSDVREIPPPTPNAFVLSERPLP